VRRFVAPTKCVFFLWLGLLFCCTFGVPPAASPYFFSEILFLELDLGRIPTVQIFVSGEYWVSTQSSPCFRVHIFLFIGSQKQESDGTFHFCCLASIFGLLDQLHLYLVSTCLFPELTLTHVPENLFFLILSFYSVAGLVNSFLLTSAFYDFWSRQKENQVNMASKIYHFVWHIGEVISFPYVWNLFVRTQPTNEDFWALA
jgi:hypothetical protein